MYDLSSEGGYWSASVNSAYSSDNTPSLVSIYSGVAVAATRAAPAALVSRLLGAGWSAGATFNSSHFAWPADAGLASPPSYTLRAVNMGDGAVAFAGLRTTPTAPSPFVVTFAYVNLSSCGAAVCVPATGDPLPAAAWVRMQILTADEADFGVAVAILRGVLVVGVPSIDVIRIYGWDGVARAWVLNTTMGPYQAVSGVPLPAAGIGFGSALSLRGLLVVGAPRGGPFTPPYSPDGGAGTAGGGAVFVFASPAGSMGGGVYSAQTTPAGIVAGRLRAVCGRAGTSAQGGLGTSVDQDVSEGATVVAAGQPYVNLVLMIAVSGGDVCVAREQVGGFRTTTEHDTGVALGFYGEMLYFGSPTASNSQISRLAAPGRLYTKAFCFPNRYLLPVSLQRPYYKICGWCATGSGSVGGSLSSCSACAGLPPGARWSGHGCSAWVCNAGYFGPLCVVCSSFMVNATLPARAHWVDGVAACTWVCDVGFIAAGQDCQPPAPPGSSRGFVLRTASWSTFRAVVLPAASVPALVAALFNATSVAAQLESVSGVVPAGAWLSPSADDLTALSQWCNASGVTANVSAAVVFLVSGLSALTAYSATIAFANVGGWGGPSSMSVSATTGPPIAPSVPRTLGAVNASGGHMGLTWSPSADSGGTVVLRYDVCLGRNCSQVPGLLAACAYSGVVQSSGTAKQGVLVPHLNATTAYCAAVRAVSAIGPSPWLFGGPFGTTAVSLPSALSDLSCSNAASVISLSWSAPTDDGGAPVSYRVAWSVNGSEVATVLAANGTRISVSGLPALTLYNIQVCRGVRVCGGAADVCGRQVAARNSAGVGAPSFMLCSTLSPALPSAPVGVRVVFVGASVISLVWRAPVDSGGVDILWYTIRVTSAAAAASALVVQGQSGSVHNLEAATIYNASVSATNGVGSGEASTPVAFVTGPLQVPSPPQALALSNASASNVIVSWTRPFDEGGEVLLLYDVRLLRFSNNASVAAVTVPSTTLSTVFAGLNASTAYVARATASSSVGVSASAFGAPISTLEAAPPTVPLNVTCSATWSTVTVQFRAPADFGGAPVTYTIQWTANASLPLANWTSVSAAVVSSVISRLRALSVYYVCVRAVNRAGVSGAMCLPSGCRTAAAVAPSPPQDVGTLSVGPSTATLGWGMPADDGGDSVILYNASVVVVPGNSTVVVCSSRSTECSVGGLLGGTLYGMVVSATNRVGVSAGSAGLFSTGPPVVPSPPGVPFLVDATGGSLAVGVAQSLDDGGSPVLSYNVSMTRDTLHFNFGMLVNRGGIGIKYGLPPSTVFYFRVTALNSVGVSRASPLSAAMSTTTVSAPSAPTLFAVTNRSWSSASVSFLPPRDTGGAAVSYDLLLLYALDNTTVLRLPGVSSPATVTHLAAVTTYRCVVSARNGFGAGDGAAVVFITTSAVVPRAPPAPVLVLSTGSSLLLTLMPPADDGGLFVTSYVASLEPAAWGGVAGVVTTNSSSALFTGLMALSVYSVTVAAVNAVGRGDFGVALLIATGPPSQPSPPRNLVCQRVSFSDAVVVWETPLDNGGVNITSFIVFVSTSAASLGPSFVVPPNVTQWDVTGLLASATYYIRMLTVNVAGMSVPCGILVVSTSPPQPPAVAASPTVFRTDCCSATFNFSSTSDSRGGPVLNYNLELFNASSIESAPLVWATVPQGVYSWVWHALPADSDFVMRVAATNIAGVANWSAFSGVAHTSSPEVPGTPVFVSLAVEPSVQPGFCGVLLQWSAPTDGGARITGYVVDLKSSSGVVLNHTVVVGASIPFALVFQVSQAGRQVNTTVAAMNVAGRGSTLVTPSILVDSTCFGAPPAPEPPTVQSVTGSRISVSWVAPSARSPTGVQLVLSPGVPQLPTVVVLPIVNTSYTFERLLGFKQYAIALAAINSAGLGPRSIAVLVMTLDASRPTAPSPPSPFQVGAADVTVQWTAPTDDGGSAVLFYAVRAANRSGHVVAGARTSALSANVIGFVAHTEYLFSVAAINRVGAGAYSAWSVPVFTAAVVRPSAPLFVACVAATSSQLDVQYTAPTDNGGEPYLTYAVYLQQRGGPGGTFVEFGSQVVNSSLQVRFFGLTGATYYRAFVTAGNAGGVSALSAASLPVLTAAPVPPSVVRAVTILDQSASTFAVAWSPPGDFGGAPVSGYMANIYATQSSSVPLGTISGSDTSVVFVALRASTTYWIGVAALNVVGQGVSSATVAGTTSVATHPTVPGVPIVVSVGPYFVGLNVSMPDDTGGLPVTQFLVYVNGSGTPLVFLVDGGESLVVDGLLGSTLYTFSAVAVNAVGGSAVSRLSVPVVTLAPVAPGPPHSSAVVATTYSSVRLAWGRPVIDGGANVTNFRVQYSVDSVVFSTPVVVGPVVSATVGNLHASTRYFFLLQAANAVGWGALTNPVALVAFTDAAVPSSPPVGVAVTLVQPSTVRVSFSDPLDSGGLDVSCYIVQTWVHGTLLNACGIAGFNASAGYVVRDLDSSVTFSAELAAAPFRVTSGDVKASTTYFYESLACSSIMLLDLPLRAPASVVAVRVRAITAGSVCAGFVCGTHDVFGAFSNVSVVFAPAWTPAQLSYPVVVAIGAASVTLNIPAGVAAGGCDVLSVRLWRSVLLAGGIWDAWVLVVSSVAVPSLVVVDSGARRATSYRYAADQVTAIGTSTFGLATPVTTRATAPSPPTSLAIGAGGASRVAIPLVWAPPLDDGGTAILYYFLYSVSVGRVVLYQGTKPSFNVTGLQPLTRMSFCVVARTGVGDSACSLTLNANTSATLPCPGNCTYPHGRCLGLDGYCTCTTSFQGLSCASYNGATLILSVVGTLLEWDAAAFRTVRGVCVCACGVCMSVLRVLCTDSCAHHGMLRNKTGGQRLAAICARKDAVGRRPVDSSCSHGRDPQY